MYYFTYIVVFIILFFFFFNDPATTEIPTLSLHDALPISCRLCRCGRPKALACDADHRGRAGFAGARSEEHTSELQSRPQLVCRLLLEKKKNNLNHFSFKITKKKQNTQ